MSDNFNNKGYEDYFKALEQQMNKSAEKPDIKNQTEKATQQKAKSHNRKKGFYKVVRLRKSVIAVFAAIVLITVSSIIVSGFSKPKPKTETEPEPTQTEQSKIEKKKKIKYAFTDDTLDIGVENDAQSIIIVDKSDNTVVAERNAHERKYPASTTKIMTLLVAVENIKNFDDTFTMSLEITDPLFVAEASVAGFLNNEQISMTDLLYGTILPSGADAAMGLAVKIAGSEEEFVKLMNNKVKELGLKNTNFANVTGLHSKQNYSSAYDMAIILDAALQNDLCREVLSTYQHTTAKTPQNPNGLLLTSTLFSYMYGNEPETATILGGKTGFVNESGYCIASYGKGNESQKEYIVVTMGNSARWPAFYGQIDLYKQFAK